MGLLSKKCEYCRNKIKKGSGVTMDVKVPGWKGTSSKNFCCKAHADMYKEKVKKQNRGGGRSCCH